MALAVTLASPPTAGFACRNGLYISPDWIEKTREVAEIDSYVTHLASANVRDYFYIAKEFKAEHRDALSRFLRSVHVHDPESRVYAMIGRGVCVNANRQNCFDLANEKHRSALVKKATDLWSAGFDGVQLDMEPVFDGDADFIAILRRLRAARPDNRALSIAGYMLDFAGAPVKPAPRPGGTPPEKWLRTWSRDYYERVLPLVDHVMVMNYDTTLNTAGDYRSFTAWQTREIRAVATNGVVVLQIGLPSNVRGRAGLYDRSAENLATGSAGVADGLGDQGSECPKNFGVTVFTEAGLTPAMFAGFVRAWATSSVHQAR